MFIYIIKNIQIYIISAQHKQYLMCRIDFSSIDTFIIYIYILPGTQKFEEGWHDYVSLIWRETNQRYTSQLMY